MTIRLTGGYLTHAAALKTSYPFTIAVWVAGNTPSSDAYVLSQDHAAVGDHCSIQIAQSGASESAVDRTVAAGSMPSTKTDTPHIQAGTMRLAVAVFTSAASRTIYFGSSTGATNGIAQPSPGVSGHDRFTVGGIGSFGTSTWDVAEAHVWDTALTSGDVASLISGTLPETIAGYIDGWSLKDYSAGGTYTSIGGTRTLTANGTVAASGVAHPISRSDATAPTLSAAVGTATGPTTATVGATTDEGNGTMYAIVSTSATPPSATQIQAGQTAAGAAAPWAGNQAVSTAGAKTFNATGLTASTVYYSHVQHRDAAGNNSAVITSASFTTSAADTTPPVLSAPVGTATGANTATVGATTDEANGTLYVVVTTSATQPSVAQIKAGQNDGGTAAAYASNQVISTTGAKTFNASGLTASTGYYSHSVHTDASGNDSNRVSSALFTTSAGGDTTPPTLSAATGAQTGPTTATVGATTNEANGTLYAVVTTSSTAPSAAQVMSGQTNTGAAAAWAGNQAVTSTGAKTLPATGLAAATAYYAHLMHRDAAGNNSNVVTSASFTTAANPSFQTPPLKNKAGSLLANLTNLTVNVYHPTTGALVQQVTGCTTNASGVAVIQSSGMTAGQTYAYEPVHATFGRRLPTAVAA